MRARERARGLQTHAHLSCTRLDHITARRGHSNTRAAAAAAGSFLFHRRFGTLRESDRSEGKETVFNAGSVGSVVTEVRGIGGALRMASGEAD